MAFEWFVLVVSVVTIVAGLPTPENNYLVLTGHQAWQVEGPTDLAAAARVLHKLEKEGVVDILGHTNEGPTFRVFPESRASVSAALQHTGIAYRVAVPDMARRVAEEAKEKEGTHIMKQRGVQGNNNPGKETCISKACAKPFISDYMTFEQIETYLQELASRSPRVELKSIGKSVEGRDIWRVLIKSRKELARRGGSVWLEGGIHAREWISPAVSLHLIDKILLDDASVMQDMEVYVVPVANPDGYVYSWTTDRLWRKNRRPNKEQNCFGVDLNRNWALQYGVGASTDPCSLLYRGTRAFSEPETQALRDEMMRVSATRELRLVVALHSYGQKLVYPWGWTKKEAPNTAFMREAGLTFATAAAKEGGALYKVDNSADGMYYASGATDDWAKGVLKTPYVYTLELPDQGSNGFILPASHILPAAQGVWKGLQELITYDNRKRGLLY